MAVFQVNLAQLGMFFNIQMNDTVLFRFTFISDSIQTNKDGLMFDDFRFLDYFEGISEIQNNNLISISPNPTKDELRIHSSIVSNNKSMQILNSIGQVITNYSNFDEETIDIRNFKNGIYLLKYSDGQNLSTKRFVVQH
ncbi:MAG: T9SS type A sorting domain-containing protein [Bacteroidetes bacterium]|nr:T9SS type A sorting domain-containing protein [Bacteroidota bacterium]